MEGKMNARTKSAVIARFKDWLNRNVSFFHWGEPAHYKEDDWKCWNTDLKRCDADLEMARRARMYG
jgi:hypothetical protein